MIFVDRSLFRLTRVHIHKYYYLNYHEQEGDLKGWICIKGEKYIARERDGKRTIKRDGRMLHDNFLEMWQLIR